MFENVLLSVKQLIGIKFQHDNDANILVLLIVLTL